MAYAESFQTVYVEENNQVHAIGDLPEGTQAIWLLAPIQGGVHESYYFEDRAFLSGVNMSTRDSIPEGWGGYSSSEQLPEGVYTWIAMSKALGSIPTASDILERASSVAIIAPEPMPDPEPTPIPDKFYICHNGKNLLIKEKAFAAHESHGDTFGECFEEPKPEPIPVPIPQIDKKDKPDEKHKPIDYNNLPNYDTFKVCHNNKIINVAANGVRYHLQHGDTQFECPSHELPTQSDKLNLKELDILELYELLTRIFEELIVRPSKNRRE